MPSIIEGVMALLNNLDTHVARQDKQNIELLSRLPWLQFCAVAFAVMVNSAITYDNVANVIALIANDCEIEARWKHYAEREEKFYDRILEQQHKSGQNTEHIDTVLKIAMNRKAEGKYKEGEKDPALMWENWPKGKDSFSHWLGAKYLDIIIAQTGLFKLRLDSYTPRNKESVKRLYTTPLFDEYITKTENRIGLYGGYYLPLPVPPRDWTTTQCGGFWTYYGGQKKLIKNWSKGYQEEVLNLTEQLSETVFPAVNAAQHTAWRINHRVLDVLQTLWDQKAKVAGLPAQDDPALPVCPKCGKVPHENHACFADPNQAEKDVYTKELVLKGKTIAEAKVAAETKFGPNKNLTLRAWKMLAASCYREQNRLKSLRKNLKIGLELADLLSGDERFYYVYQTDFRGRLYPCGVLNPQGTDWQKGILEFADGVELGEHGAKWLAVQLANTWGNDKVSFEERVRWVQNNEKIILACAENPLDCLDWTEADEPFCFLAACFEWSQYKTEGNSYKSHLAIALDGSCSGIQHYSAMLQDEVGAIATNVKCVDPEKGKHDIYGEVAAATINLMKTDVASAEFGEPATFLLAHKLIDRKVVKRAVMTLPYGSKYRSCCYYVSEELSARLQEKGITDAKQLMEYGQYASKRVWAAIPMVVQKAREGMNYLQALAHLFTKQKMPITWTTPTGFVVQQSYYSVKGKVINLYTGGSIILKNGLPTWQTTGERNQITFQSIDTREIDPTRQVSGIAPNFIHSLDASHLMMSVKEASAQGIHNFALIHDSLGVHAGETEKFATIIRDCFYKLYAENTPLVDITTHLLNQLDDDLQHKAPAMPTLGTLDLNDIKRAKYLFA